MRAPLTWGRGVVPAMSEAQEEDLYQAQEDQAQEEEGVPELRKGVQEKLCVLCSSADKASDAPKSG